MLEIKVKPRKGHTRKINHKMSESRVMYRNTIKRCAGLRMMTSSIGNNNTSLG